MDPITGAALIGAGSSFLQGKGGQQVTEGLTLPPALQAGMLEKSQNALRAFESDISSIEGLVETYTNRINTIEQGIEGTIPSDELNQQLANSSAEIAIQLGAEAKDLIGSGFLDEDDIARIEALDELQQQDFRDEGFEQEFEQQRQALEQDLLRDGRGAAEIAQTLSQFDSQKAVERQQRGEALRTSSFNRGLATIQAKQGIRAQNFGLAQGALGAQAGVLGQAQQAQGQLAGLAGAAFTAEQQGIQQRSNLYNQIQGVYSNIGQYDLDEKDLRGIAAIQDNYLGGSKADKGLNAITGGAWGSTKTVGKGVKKLVKSIF